MWTFVVVRFDTQVIPKKRVSCTWLVIQGNGEIDEDATHFIGAGVNEMEAHI